MCRPVARRLRQDMRVWKRSPSELDPGDVERFVGSSFFCSPGFANLWRAKKGRPVYWVAEAAGEPVALLPGVEFGRGPWSRFMSMPDGCYGGVFFANEANGERDEAAARLLDAVARSGYAKVHIFDFYDSLPEDSRFEAVSCRTTLVDISDPEWHPPDRKLQSQIRKACREGVRVERFDWRLHGGKFRRLVSDTERRHSQKPRYPSRFFKALSMLAGKDERIQWLWCERDGVAVSSHIYFVENGILQGWQKYLDKRFSFLKPDQYIRFWACRRAAQLGIGRLNLGATPGEARGLAYYKRRWGGDTIQYTCRTLKQGLGRLF